MCCLGNHNYVVFTAKEIHMLRAVLKNSCLQVESLKIFRLNSCLAFHYLLKNCRWSVKESFKQDPSITDVAGCASAFISLKTGVENY